MRYAIIPARGGSKRIPGKNIKCFCGKPLIAYSIDAALRSELFDKVIVSTDSEKIAEVAKKYGAEVPFLRPSEISDDFTPTQDVLSHALTYLLESGENIDYFCCIYPTAPLLNIHYLKRGLEIIKEKKCETVMSVTSFPYPIFRGLKLEESGELSMFWPEHELTRSNDLPEAYHDAGQFYWIDALKFNLSKRMVPENTFPCKLPRYMVQDIDTPEDWENAELIYEMCKQRGLI